MPQDGTRAEEGNVKWVIENIPRWNDTEPQKARASAFLLAQLKYDRPGSCWCNGSGAEREATNGALGYHLAQTSTWHGKGTQRTLYTRIAPWQGIIHIRSPRHPVPTLSSSALHHLVVVKRHFLDPILRHNLDYQALEVYR